MTEHEKPKNIYILRDFKEKNKSHTKDQVPESFKLLSNNAESYHAMP